MVTDQVLDDEARLQLSLVIVGLPLIALPLLFAARKRYGRARAQMIASLR